MVNPAVFEMPKESRTVIRHDEADVGWRADGVNDADLGIADDAVHLGSASKDAAAKSYASVTVVSVLALRPGDLNKMSRVENATRGK
ncbi:MAG: hypothetical protein GEU95_20400 [Rhizobiales bacterium]|nr:hypothetical protein [Hyphomicrobiales bacterium]